VNLYVGPFSQTEFWWSASYLSLAVLSVLICFGYLLPQIRYLKALLEGKATNISPRSLWYRGLTLCLIIAVNLLWFRYSDTSLQLLAKEAADETIDKLIFGMGQSEFFYFLELLSLSIIALSAVVFTRKLINLAMTAAQIAADQALQKLKARQPNLNPAPTSQNLLQRIGAARLIMVGGVLLAVIMLFALTFDKSPVVTDFRNDDPAIYWGMSKIDLINLAEMLVLLALIILVFVLVIIPLFVEAFVATQRAANVISGQSHAPIPSAALLKGKVIAALLIVVIYSAMYFDFLSYLFSKLPF